MGRVRYDVVFKQPETPKSPSYVGLKPWNSYKPFLFFFESYPFLTASLFHSATAENGIRGSQKHEFEASVYTVSPNLLIMLSRIRRLLAIFCLRIANSFTSDS